MGAALSDAPDRTVSYEANRSLWEAWTAVHADGDCHPVAQVFEDEGVGPGELRLQYPYWEHRDSLIFDVHGSYADPTADVGEQKEHGWDHGLGEIVTALITAGLQLEWLRESPVLDWGTDFLVETEPGSGRFRLPLDIPGELPLMFSLMARKPVN